LREKFVQILFQKGIFTGLTDLIALIILYLHNLTSEFSYVSTKNHFEQIYLSPDVKKCASNNIEPDSNVAM